MATSTTPPGKTGRHQRSMKNMLLDKHFQLKYTGYLVAIALAISVSLGAVLLMISGQLVDQGKQSAEQGQQIVALGEEVVGESRKVSAVVRMNIVKDPIYQDDPDLLAAFNADADQQDTKLDDQMKQFEEQRGKLVAQANKLESLRMKLLLSLAGILTLLVVAIGLAGIFVTHKVAGPIFKMKRHLGEVADGKYVVPWSLRKGDELVEFFEAFRSMVVAIREEREGQMAVIEKAVEATADQPEIQKSLQDLHAGMEKSLG